MAFTKWYTSSGDDGYTGVLGRDRVPKYALRPEAYGTVDESSALLGVARAQAQDQRVRQAILVVQRDLYKMMADLATVPEVARRPPGCRPNGGLARTGDRRVGRRGEDATRFYRAG